jgi:protein-tyrosine phosphatase
MKCRRRVSIHWKTWKKLLPCFGSVNAEVVNVAQIKVLFVCMGNICRSPTAEGVFTALAARHQMASHLHVDSAGTHAYHVGDPPDPRAQNAALRRGIDLSRLRARRVSLRDFHEYDYVLAMDADNYAHLLQLCPDEARYKLKMFLEFAPHLNESDVPDPYYGGELGFERVLDMVEAASEGLLDHIRKTHFNM